MTIRNLVIGALVATSVAAVPVAATASKARHAAVAKVSAVRKSASHAGGLDTGTLVIAVLGAGAVIGGAIAISSNSKPSSP